MQGAAGESSSQASTGISHLARPTLLPHYQHALVLVPVHALRHVPGLSAAAPGELESGCAVVVRGWVERERAREGIDLAEAATRLRCIGC